MSSALLTIGKSVDASEMETQVANLVDEILHNGDPLRSFVFLKQVSNMADEVMDRIKEDAITAFELRGEKEARIGLAIVTTKSAARQYTYSEEVSAKELAVARLNSELKALKEFERKSNVAKEVGEAPRSIVVKFV